MKKIKFRKVCTRWNLSIKFISETGRDKGNMSFYLFYDLQE